MSAIKEITPDKIRRLQAGLRRAKKGIKKLEAGVFWQRHLVVMLAKAVNSIARIIINDAANSARKA